MRNCCVLLAACLMFVLMVGCGEGGELPLSEMSVSAPEIQRGHIYDDETLLATWPIVNKADYYIVALLELNEWQFGDSPREQFLFHVIVGGGETSLEITRKDSYFFLADPQKPKSLSIRVYPMEGDPVPGQHPYDYDSNDHLYEREYIPFRWYQRDGMVNDLRSYVAQQSERLELVPIALRSYYHPFLVLQGPTGEILPEGAMCELKIFKFGKQVHSGLHNYKTTIHKHQGRYGEYSGLYLPADGDEIHLRFVWLTGEQPIAGPWVDSSSAYLMVNALSEEFEEFVDQIYNLLSVMFESKDQ